MDGIKNEIVAFFEGLLMGIGFHLVLVLIIFVVYMSFIARHRRAFVVLAAVAIWLIIAARAAGFTL